MVAELLSLVSELCIDRDGVAGVVVSCKIPILATRVRFPGDATYFMRVVTSYVCVTRFELPVLWVPAWPNG